MKKIITLLISIILFSSLVAAETITVEFPNGDKVKSGADLTIKGTLYDSNNNAIDGTLLLTVKNPSKSTVIEKGISSKQIVNLNLGQTPIAGEWKLTIKYNEIEITEPFFVVESESVSFEIVDSNLIIKNTGNIPYLKNMEIIIGETKTDKEISLAVGEQKSLTLVAPEGNYNVIVNIEGKSVFTQSNVALRGKGLTGEAIGVLDESTLGRGGITGGISPDQEEDSALLGYSRGNGFVYVFILIIFGAMILLAIERRFKKKAEKKEQ